MKNTICGAVVLAVFLLAAPSARADTLYGGNGGHNNGDSINDGSLVTINQANAAVTLVGHPTGIARISGLAFDFSGVLFGSTQGAGGFPPPPGPTAASDLITINPANGASLSNVLIQDTLGNALSIADLAVQPGTNALYGISGPQMNNPGLLYTINKTTGVATLVGNTGAFFGSIAFNLGGTLYMSFATLDPSTGNIINISLKTLNPATGAVLSSVSTVDFFGALGIRSDGVIFGGTGDSAGLFTINPNTGAETLIGSTGQNFVGDLAFTTVPEPSTLLLLGTGLSSLVAMRRKRR
jgi:hypothetical protein